MVSPKAPMLGLSYGLGSVHRQKYVDSLMTTQSSFKLRNHSYSNEKLTVLIISVGYFCNHIFDIVNLQCHLSSKSSWIDCSVQYLDVDHLAEMISRLFKVEEISGIEKLKTPKKPKQSRTQPCGWDAKDAKIILPSQFIIIFENILPILLEILIFIAPFLSISNQC